MSAEHIEAMGLLMANENECVRSTIAAHTQVPQGAIVEVDCDRDIPRAFNPGHAVVVDDKTASVLLVVRGTCQGMLSNRMLPNIVSIHSRS